MAYYRQQYTRSSWQWRIDFIPYDEAAGLGAAQVDLAPGVVVMVSKPAAGFDTLPLGLATNSGAKFAFNLSRCPAAMATAIREGTDATDARNVVVLWSDRGTAGATWTVEGMYVHTNVESGTRKRTAGQWVQELDMQDAFAWAMQRMRGYELFASSVSPYEVEPPESSKGYNELQDVNGTNQRPTISHGLADTGHKAWPSSCSYVAGIMRPNMSAAFNTYANRSASVAAGYVSNSADLAGALDYVFTTGVRYYKPRDQDGATRTPVAELQTNETLLITNVRDGSNNTVGGMFHRADEAALARIESAYDCMRDIAEASYVKLSYVYELRDAGSNPWLAVVWRVRRPLAQKRVQDGIVNSEAQPTLSTGSFESQEIRSGAHVIGRAQVQAKVYGENDVSDFTYSANVHRGNQTFTARVPLHNMPTYKEKVRDDRHGRDWLEFYRKGLLQTNLVCCLAGGNDGQLTKTHETVRYWHDDVEYYEHENNALSTAVPTKDATTEGWGYVFGGASDLEIARAAHTGWVIEMQRTSCSPSGLAAALVELFGNNKQAEFDVVVSIHSAPGLLEMLGQVFDISGDAENTDIAYDRSVCTKVEVDPAAMTVAYTFLAVPSTL